MRSFLRCISDQLQRLRLRGVVGAFLLLLAVAAPRAAWGAVAATVLAEGGSSTDTATYTTASISPASDALILAWVSNNKPPPATIPPTLTGNGLTWVQVATVTWGTIPTPNFRTTLYRAMGASPSSGSVTISFAANQKNCAWTIEQFTGVEVSGTNGSGAVVQAVTAAADNALATAGLTITLAGMGNDLNLAAGGFSNNMDEATPILAGAGFTSSLGASTASPKTNIMAEWVTPGRTAVNVTQANKAHIGGIAVEVKSATTTLGNGSDSGDVTVAPGGAASFVDAFTFQTNGGSSAVSSVTVTLAAGSSGGISLLEITDSSGATVYGSVTNPGSDSVAVPISGITAATTLATYKVRITPKGHSSLPSPPGSTYQVTAYVSNWSDNNIHAGSDSGGTTVSIDNESPGNIDAALASRNGGEIALSWTNPWDADLGIILVLRKTGGVVTDVPTEGNSYTVGNELAGGSVVACVVASPDSSCNDSGLLAGTRYYYKAFARDTRGNYSPGGVDAYYYQPDLAIKLASDESGGFLTDNVYEGAATTQVKAQGVLSGLAATYHVRLENDGTGVDSLLLSGTGNGSNFTIHYLDEGAVERTDAVIGGGYIISGLAVGASREWTVTVTPSGGGTPVPGGSSYPVQVTATSLVDITKLDQVKAVTSSNSARLTLLKSADKSTYLPGEDITYTITAGNGASLTSASGISVTDAIPLHTAFKVGGATFDAGSSTLTATITYYNEGVEITPESGGCDAPSGYDYCVTRVKWEMQGAMPTATSFVCHLVVRVK